MSETTSSRTRASSTRVTTRTIAVTALFSAIAFVLQYIEVPVVFMPSFIKFDFSDLPALIGAFAYGPACGIIIELVKNVLHSFVSLSFGIGEISNFLLGAVFVGVAGLIYRNHKTKKGAVAASFIGAIAMAAFSFPCNLLIVYPVYYNFMPKETIISAYQLIFSKVTTIEQCLLIFNVPFTFIKGMIDAVITFLIYKKISPVLHGRH